MLKQSELLLLTAGVDGEINTVEAEALEQLLAQSNEARELYRRLSQDRDGLIYARRETAPTKLKARIDRHIAAITPRTVSQEKPAPRSSRRRDPLVPVAYLMAASFFFMVIGTSYWISTQQLGQPAVADRSETETQQQDVQPARNANPVKSNVQVATSDNIETLPTPRMPGSAKVQVAELTPAPNKSIELISEPRMRDNSIVGSPIAPIQDNLIAAEARIPLLLPVNELDFPESQARLKAELSRDPAFRIDLFTNDTVAGTASLLSALKSVGVTTHTDAVASERFKKKVPTAWMFYTESLTAEELAKVAANLGKKDRAASDSPIFSHMHLIPARNQEERDLKELLGLDPGLWKRAASASDKDTGPISSGTVGQLTANLAKQNGKDKLAAMLTYLPVAGRSNAQSSRELKEYFRLRPARQEGTIPVMIVVRPAN